jgi:RimJ/RimL family protein N-acetyltransferase
LYMTVNLQPTHLEDELVALVPLRKNHFDALYKVASNPLIWEQHPTRDRYKKEVFQLYFDSAMASGSAFVVIDKKCNELAGCSRYYDHDETESKIAIGYTFLAIKFWGGIYNGAVKKLMLDYAFQFVDTVLFHIGPNNIRSQKAVEKIHGKKIRDMLYEGNRHCEYAIHKADWLNGSF